MTESHPPHPTDEDLSAAIDGYDHAGVVEHAGGCERCRYRMDAMRGVAAVLREPVAVDELARERAIAAAVRVQTAPAGSRRWLGWAGAAAAVLVALLMVPVLFGGDDKADMATTASDESAESSGGQMSRSGGLGSYNDPGALRTALVGVLSEGIGGATASEGLMEDRAASPSTTTTAVDAPKAGSGRAAAFSTGVCADQISKEYGDRLGAELYSAGLTYQDHPSVVRVYEFSGRRLALVLRQSDCQLLASVSL